MNGSSRTPIPTGRARKGRGTMRKRTDDGFLPCPKCLGQNFAPAQIVQWPNAREKKCPHTKCLDCRTVSYAPLADGWETNMYCGNPKEHWRAADSHRQGEKYE